MSTGVDQATSKAQPEAVAANGPSSKQPADYSYMHGQQQQQQQQPTGYMSGQNLVDAYMPSYYTPYLSYPATQGRPMGEPSWSAQDPVSYMTGGYNVPASYGGMYNQFDYSQHPGYGWFPGGGEYGDWGTSSDGYYTMSDGMQEGYGGAPANGETDVSDVDGMKVVERSMNSMGLGDSMDGGHYGDRSTGPYNSRSSGAGGSVQKKPVSWAGIASQPASSQSGKNQLIPRAPLQPNRIDNSGWDAKNRQGAAGGAMGPARSRGGRPMAAASGPYRPGGGASELSRGGDSDHAPADSSPSSLHPANDKLMDPSTYNPKEFDLTAKGARFFIIKSYSEDDIHRSIKYSIWCSTEYGNKRLDSAFRERDGKGPVYLLFSVNGSGHFCGMAQMMTAIDYGAQANVWAQDKWKGSFEVKWIYVKDVPNSQLRHIKLENNEGKPVTNSRDTQEVLGEKGLQVLRIIHQYRHTTSIFDDFSHYEKRQEEDVHERK